VLVTWAYGAATDTGTARGRATDRSRYVVTPKDIGTDLPKEYRFMPGVEEIRAGIALANEKASASIAALQQAAQALEEAQQSLAQATSGSAQEDVSQAHGLLAETVQGITGMQSTILACITSAENYSARL
jgi:hypothetical protein